MILECPSCSAKYLVQIGLLAQGGRQVRCARCKHEWHAVLPTTIDVYTPPPEPEATPEVTSEDTVPVTEPISSSQPEEGGENTTANLPAVISGRGWRRQAFRVVGVVVLVLLSILWPILDRQPIVKAIPELWGVYEFFHLHIKRSGDGLVFDQVKSELGYDGGTEWLYITGVIHNNTAELQLIPDIKARALGPDRHIIQSWWVEAPAATIAPGGEVPFHTRIAAPMQRTTESVYLEFYAREEKGDVEQ